MTFVDIPAGMSLFVDANVFVFDVTAHVKFGPSCRQFMQRIARREIIAFTSADALSDVAHRVMTLEAAIKLNRPLTGMATYLKSHPSVITGLSLFRQAVDDIVQIGVRVLNSEGSHVLAAAALSQQHGLLSGDALIAAVMHANGITNIASQDADFDRVSSITRFAPI